MERKEKQMEDEKYKRGLSLSAKQRRQDINTPDGLALPSTASVSSACPSWLTRCLRRAAQALPVTHCCSVPNSPGGSWFLLKLGVSHGLNLSPGG